MEGSDQYCQFPEAKYECAMFDLDDTLYPFSSGLAAKITQNIQEYMIQKLDIEENKVPELCVSLYKIFGTTLAGLGAVGYNIDYDDFHSFVHGRLPYNMLKPDPALRNLLLSMPVRKVIFTNSDKAHAARALSRLGLEDCFDKILCFETLNPADNCAGTESGNASTEIFDISTYLSDPKSGLVLPKTPVVCKPSEEAFQEVFKIANIDPKKTLFFDDSIRNLHAGKSLGLHTVLVGSSQRAKDVDYALESIHIMREAFPGLFEAAEKTESVCYTGKVSLETQVRA